MKKIYFKTILYGILAFIQISLIIASFIIQELTNKRAGVMRHVYTRKYQYESSILSPDNIEKLKMISIIIILLILIMVVYYLIKNRKINFLSIQYLIGIILSIGLYIVLTSTYFISKLAYPYFIFAFLAATLIQIIIVGVILLNKKEK